MMEAEAGKTDQHGPKKEDSLTKVMLHFYFFH